MINFYYILFFYYLPLQNKQRVIGEQFLKPFCFPNNCDPWKYRRMWQLRLVRHNFGILVLSDKNYNFFSFSIDWPTNTLWIRLLNKLSSSPLSEKVKLGFQLSSYQGNPVYIITGFLPYRGHFTNDVSLWDDLWKAVNHYSKN